MKRVSTLVLSLVMIAAMFVSFAACGGGDAIKGKWESENIYDMVSLWDFNGSGKCTLTNTVVYDDPKDNTSIKMNGTYTIDEEAGTLVIKIDDWSDSKSYTYTLDGNKLILDTDDVYTSGYDLTKK